MSSIVQDVQNVFPRLIAINREAFAQAHYEVAYHALAAALHSACDEGDRERVRDVQTIAMRQRDWIDAHRPDHRLSTNSAKSRGQRSMFTMLECQAAAAGHISFKSRWAP